LIKQVPNEGMVDTHVLVCAKFRACEDQFNVAESRSRED